MAKETFQKQPPQPKSKDLIANKVEVQKGRIDPNPMTIGQMTYLESRSAQITENALRRSGQTLTLHQPKTGKR
jgi:hypothetical protein